VQSIVKAPWYLNLAGVLLFVLGVVSVVVMTTSAAEDRADNETFRQYVECNARWQDDWTAAQRERADAAAQDRMLDRQAEQNITTLIASVSAAVGDRPMIRAAFDAWEARTAEIVAARRDVEQQRADAPLPEPPVEACGLPTDGTEEN
jgi:hypothetical protein